MSDEVKGSSNDVDSFSMDEKNELAKKNFVVVMDVRKKKGKARKTEVYTGILNGIKMYTVGIDDSFKRKTRTKPVDRVVALGFEKEITEKLVFEIREGSITSQNLDDFGKTNLIEKICKLDSKSRQTIAQTLSNNKKERDIKNTEDISVVFLQNGTINNYFTENWYSGLLRTIMKLSQQATVNKEIVQELSDQQNSVLTGCTKDLIPILENMLRLLNTKQIQP